MRIIETYCCVATTFSVEADGIWNKKNDSSAVHQDLKQKREDLMIYPCL